MIVTLLAPELTLMVALDEFLHAVASVKLMRNTPECREIVERGGWTMTHAFYAHMGGFMLRERIVGEPDQAVSKEQELVEAATPPTPMITFRPFVRVGVTEIVSSLESGLLRSSSPDFITTCEIRDRAKGDIFLKCIAAFQVLWFIVQVCARKARNLPISQLEIAVLALCISTLASYAFWWTKPQDLIVPSYLDATRAMTDEERPNLQDSSRGMEGVPGYEYLISSPFSNLPFARNVGMPGIGLGGTVFGAIHMLAWKAHFPSDLERSLWRYCSVAATIVPLILWPLAQALSKWVTQIRGLETLTIIFLLGIIFVYALCRVFIVVETLRSLGFLPAGAFATTWSTYVPHVM